MHHIKHIFFTALLYFLLSLHPIVPQCKASDEINLNKGTLINIAPTKRITVKEIVDEINCQIGTRIMIDRDVRISTLEINIEIINLNLENAIKKVFLSYNNSELPPLKYKKKVIKRELTYRMEDGIYVLMYANKPLIED